jgi:pimeloyl-ACP methyl ester carboxylesterase
MPYTTIDSLDIHYQDIQRGEDGEHTLLFVHGAGGNLLSWSGQVGYPFENCALLVPELPGHGDSKGGGFDSIPRYASTLVKFLDSLSRSKVIAVGHSMGGAIALHMALQEPDRIEAGVLIDTAPALPVNRIIFETIAKGPAAAAALVCKFSFSRTAPQQLVDRTVQEMSRCSKEVLEKDFTACNTFDQTSTLYALSSPFLIICGEEDKMTPPSNSEFMKNEITDSELVIIEGAGHMSMLEKPQEVNRTIANFLKSIGIC